MMPDTRFGSYEVQALIGSGGMSEVYRARDVRLNREVAVKVLGRPFASDPAWLARFDREAQLLAALNHPHIAQIYGFEELAPAPDQSAVRALVMELVDGSTLAERIAGGPIAIEEALAIAGQIAEALEAAHERGIVHRDLKPANVKLTSAGVVKVLDFGLGKVVTPGDGVDLPATTSSSPTVTAPATRSGVILGTAAYMAPEQARGQTVDKRTDIWAFGVVLYEMLTGQRPFEGETASDTIAAVLREEVDWGRLPPATPGEVKRMLRRCLERNPKNRWQDAGDLRLAIADARIGTDAVDHASRRSRAWSRRWLAVALTAGAVAIGAAFGAAWTALRDARRVDTQRPAVRFAIEPAANVANISYVAAAADGRFIVYEAQIDGEFHLFVRRLDELTSRQLAGTEGGRGPFISPDGRWIGFVRGGKIPRQPSRITRLTEQHVDNGGSVSPDERWLAYQSAAIGRSVVYVRSLTTSEPATALSRDPREFPVFLRDGKTLALVRGRQLMVRPWHVNAGRFEIGAERVVTQLTFGSGWTYGSPYDVTDGGRFLAIVRTEEAPPPRVRVVLGWDHDVTRLGQENRAGQ